MMNVLITGGTGGIGFAVAEHFGRLGHHVILADINSSQLELRQRELEAAGYKASSILLNLMDQIFHRSLRPGLSNRYSDQQCRSAARRQAGRFS